MTSPLDKRTSLLEVAGAGERPHLILRFETVEEMQAASDYIRMLSVPEHLRDPMAVLERGRQLEEMTTV